MITTIWRRAALSLFVAVSISLGAQQPLQPAPLPAQHIVMVVDNSTSMDMPPNASDPLRVRGVAASLVLDAAELASEVQAGLVLFDGDAQSDRQLHTADYVRQNLQADRLPPAGSGTNIRNALEIALSMLSGSSAPIRRIVLITDGMPYPPSQQEEIVKTLVPNAERAGVQIFALGLSANIDQAFLDRVTKPTGGKTLIALQHQKLLETAKQLIGDHDNVFTMANRSLAPGTSEFQFTITPGVDRARITAILDDPRGVATSDLTFSLAGPPSAGERTYTIRPQDNECVAAWTAFVSTPGTYTLKVDAQKGHKGLRLIVEALSNLRVAATLTPPDTRYAFGSEVGVTVQVANANGSVDANAVTITGTVRTPGGGTEVIAFNGLEGRFKVRDAAGRHTVVVKANTTQPRASAEARIEYDAIAPDAVHLTVTPEKLDFVRALGPSDTKIETTFRLVPEFPQGTKPHPLKVGFLFTTPAGQMELATSGGGTIRANGPPTFMLPPAGAEIVARIRLDPNRPLPAEAGRQQSSIRIFSPDAGELTVPFEYQIRIPEFKVDDAPEAFVLWWDPLAPRVVDLGSVHTDLADASTFTVTIPEAVSDPKRGTLIANLALRANGKALDPTPAEAGKVRYGPIELTPGEELPLELVVTPHRNTGWQQLPAAAKMIRVELASTLGMRTAITPKLLTAGPPLWGRIDKHGRTIVTLVVVGTFALLLVLLALSRLGEVRRFWTVRPGTILPLGFGAIEIGGGSEAALALPNSGSPLDNEIVGKVSADGRRQRVESINGHLVTTRPVLSPGDTIAITDDTGSEEGNQPIWELSYVNSVPSEGGEVEVITSPSEWTLARVCRRFFFGIIIAGALYLFLGLSIAAAIAYHFGFIETVYVWLLQ